MTDKRQKKQGLSGTVLILLGLLCFAGAAFLTAYNYWDAARAEKASREIMLQMEKLVGETEDLSDPEKEDLPASLSESSMALPDSSAEVSYREMPAVEIDGCMYIGFLNIPSLDLTLPVMQKWDYERLKISPCRYSGSYFTDDLVICAHNYARHFSPVKGISMGADVWFVTAAGKKIHYTATNIQTIAPADIREMIQNNKNSLSGSEWDLTLFTCNTGGTTRCAVRCERVDDK